MGCSLPVLNLKLKFEVEQTAEGKQRAKNVLLVRLAGTAVQARGRAPARWERSNVFALAFFGLCATWG
jgi:hypothetical protein